MTSPNPTHDFIVSLLGPRPHAAGDVDWTEAVRLLRFHQLVGLAFGGPGRGGDDSPARGPR